MLELPQEQLDKLTFNENDVRLYFRIYKVMGNLRSHTPMMVNFMFHVARNMAQTANTPEEQKLIGKQIGKVVVLHRDMMYRSLVNGARGLAAIAKTTKDIPDFKSIQYDDIDEMFRTTKYVQAYLNRYWPKENWNNQQPLDQPQPRLEALNLEKFKQEYLDLEIFKQGDIKDNKLQEYKEKKAINDALKKQGIDINNFGNLNTEQLQKAYEELVNDNKLFEQVGDKYKSDKVIKELLTDIKKIKTEMDNNNNSQKKKTELEKSLKPRVKRLNEALIMRMLPESSVNALTPYKTFLDKSGGMAFGWKGWAQTIMNLRQIFGFHGIVAAAVGGLVTWSMLGWAVSGLIPAGIVVVGMLALVVVFSVGMRAWEKRWQTNDELKLYGKPVSPGKGRVVSKGSSGALRNGALWTVIFGVKTFWNFFIFKNALTLLTGKGVTSVVLPLPSASIIMPLIFVLIAGYLILQPRMDKLAKSWLMKHPSQKKTRSFVKNFGAPALMALLAIVWGTVAGLGYGYVLTATLISIPLLFFFLLDTYAFFYIFESIIGFGISLKAGHNVLFVNKWNNIKDWQNNNKLYQMFMLKVVPDKVAQTLSEDEKQMAFALYWNKNIEELYFRGLIGAVERANFSYKFNDDRNESVDYLSGTIKQKPNIDVEPKNPHAIEYFHDQVMKRLMTGSNRALDLKDVNFTVAMPVYNEGVLYQLDTKAELAPPLNQAYERGGHTFLTYIIERNSNKKENWSEWDNLIERINAGKNFLGRDGRDGFEYKDGKIVFTADEEADIKAMGLLKPGQKLVIKTDWIKHEIEMWGSQRLQPLGKTIKGVMQYEDAIKFQSDLQNHKMDKQARDAEADINAKEKFQFLVSYQTYGDLCASNAAPDLKEKRKTVIRMMQYYPNLEVAYIDSKKERNEKTGKDEDVFYSVLMKGVNPVTGEPNEIARVKLSGRAVRGQGKPENHNHMMTFVRHEFTQTVDINQDMSFASGVNNAFRILREFHNPNVVLVGFPETIGTKDFSQIAKFAAHGDEAFNNPTQPFLAFFKVRGSYGHPDFYRTSYLWTKGGLSKNVVSEDLMGAMSAIDRGGEVVFAEDSVMEKEREVGYVNTVGMFVKFSAGSSQYFQSRYMNSIRDSKAWGSNLLVRSLRTLSFFFGGPGFYYKEPGVKALNTFYNIILMFFGLSAYAIFPSELLLGILGVFLFAQASTSMGLVKALFDKGIGKGLLGLLASIGIAAFFPHIAILGIPLVALLAGFLGILLLVQAGNWFHLRSSLDKVLGGGLVYWLKMLVLSLPYNQSQILTHASGVRTGMDGDADYIATGRGPGLEHTMLFSTQKGDNPIYGFESSHLSWALGNMILVVLSLSLWSNISFWMSIFFIVLPFSTYLSAVFYNPGATPLDVGWKKWRELFIKDMTEWFKLMKTGVMVDKDGNKEPVSRVRLFIHGAVLLPVIAVVAALTFPFSKKTTTKGIKFSIGIGVFSIALGAVILSIKYMVLTWALNIGGLQMLASAVLALFPAWAFNTVLGFALIAGGIYILIKGTRLADEDYAEAYKNDAAPFNKEEIDEKQFIKDRIMGFIKDDKIIGYNLINEVFVNNGINLNDVASVTQERLKNAFNELIQIPNLTELLNNGNKLDKAKGWEEVIRDARKDGANKGKSDDELKALIKIKNKHKLAEIYAFTDEVQASLYEPGKISIKNFLEDNKIQYKVINEVFAKHGIDLSNDKTIKSEQLALAFTELVEISNFEYLLENNRGLSEAARRKANVRTIINNKHIIAKLYPSTDGVTDLPYETEKMNINKFVNAPRQTLRLITEMFAKYGIDLDNAGSITKARLNGALNELIRIPNLEGLLKDNAGLSRAKAGVADNKTIIKNKYRLTALYPFLDEITASPYDKKNIDEGNFKQGNKLQYKLINEVFAKNGIKLNDVASVTQEQLAKAFNELIQIPNFIDLLANDFKLDKAKGWEEVIKNARKEDANKGKSDDEIKAPIIIKNKHKLAELYPSSDEIEALDYQPGMINADKFIKAKGIQNEFINKALAGNGIDINDAGTVNKETLANAFNALLDMPNLCENVDTSKYKEVRNKNSLLKDIGRLSSNTEPKIEDIRKVNKAILLMSKEYSKTLELSKDIDKKIANAKDDRNKEIKALFAPVMKVITPIIDFIKRHKTAVVLSSMGLFVIGMFVAGTISVSLTAGIVAAVPTAVLLFGAYLIIIKTVRAKIASKRKPTGNSDQEPLVPTSPYNGTPPQGPSNVTNETTPPTEENKTVPSVENIPVNNEENGQNEADVSGKSAAKERAEAELRAASAAVWKNKVLKNIEENLAYQEEKNDMYDTVRKNLEHAVNEIAGQDG